MKNKSILALFFVFLFTLWIRTFHLKTNPPGFYFDEASTGYDAYCIIKTGRDMWGVKYPIFFKSWGDYKEGSLRYISIPFILIIGLNEWAVRLPSALLGSFSVLFAYFLGKYFFEDRKAGLLTAFLLAVSPWHIFISRVGLRMVTLPFFYMLALCFLLRFLKGKENSLSISALFFGLSLYTYIAARLFIPLILLAAIISFHKSIKLNFRFIISLLIFLICSLPLVHFFLTDREGFMMRYQMIAISQESKGTFAVVGRFLKNFLSYYSLNFLFFNGDADLSHSPKGYGQLYPVLLPILIIGFIFLFLKKHKCRFFLLLWLIIYPISGSLSVEGTPNAIRVVGVFPLFELIASYGFISAIEALNLNSRHLLKNLLIITFISGLAFYSFNFLHHLFNEYPLYAGKIWDYGWREMMEYAQKNQDKYEEIIITRYVNCPLVLTLFYTKYPPELYLQNRGMGMKYRFYPQWAKIEEYFYSTDKKGLYFLREFELPNEHYIWQVKYPNGEMAFKAVEND